MIPENVLRPKSNYPEPSRSQKLFSFQIFLGSVFVLDAVDFDD